MKTRIVGTFLVLAAAPALFAQLRVEVDLRGGAESIASTAKASYWGGTFTYEIDPNMFVTMAHDISGPLSSRGGASGYGQIESQNGVMNPPPFTGTRLPSGCYRATADASAQKNNREYATQGAGSPEFCLQDPPPDNGGGGGDQLHWDGGTNWFDPLVLDLNGDGVHTTGLDRAVSFDLDANGSAETITWTDPTTDEGFLWIDLNDNGVADDGRELFGIGTELPGGGKARDGFEALAVHDDALYGGNGDGMITTADAVWNRLRIWVDRSHDGLCDGDERAPLQRYGIRELRLSAGSVPRRDNAGNLHVVRGEYLRQLAGSAQVRYWTFALESLVFQSGL